MEAPPTMIGKPVKCPLCATTFIASLPAAVDPKAPQPGSAASSPSDGPQKELPEITGLVGAAPDPARPPRWFIRTSKGESGPYSRKDLAKAAAQGKITFDTAVKDDRSGKTVMAGEIPGVFPSKRPAAAPAPAPTPTPMQAPSPPPAAKLAQPAREQAAKPVAPKPASAAAPKGAGPAKVSPPAMPAPPRRPAPAQDKGAGDFAALEAALSQSASRRPKPAFTAPTDLAAVAAAVGGKGSQPAPKAEGATASPAPMTPESGLPASPAAQPPQAMPDQPGTPVPQVAGGARVAAGSRGGLKKIILLVVGLVLVVAGVVGGMLWYGARYRKAIYPEILNQTPEGMGAGQTKPEEAHQAWIGKNVQTLGLATEISKSARTVFLDMSPRNQGPPKAVEPDKRRGFLCEFDADRAGDLDMVQANYFTGMRGKVKEFRGNVIVLEKCQAVDQGQPTKAVQDFVTAMDGQWQNPAGERHRFYLEPYAGKLSESGGLGADQNYTLIELADKTLKFRFDSPPKQGADTEGFIRKISDNEIEAKTWFAAGPVKFTRVQR
jgi:hypothetical protein